MNTSQIVLPQPDELTRKEKDDAMGAYLMMFAALGVGLPLPVLNLVAASIYYFLNRRTSDFVGFHALQSLLSPIPVTLFNVAVVKWLIRILATDLIFPTPFFVLLAAMVLANAVYISFSIIAMVKARRGLFYYMPVFGRIAFARHYVNRTASKPAGTNVPPEGF